MGQDGEAGRRGSVFKTMAFGGLVLVAIVTASMALIVGDLGKFLEEVSSISAVDLAIVSSLMLAAEAVKALRLKAFTGASIIASFYARLIGRFAGALTPGGVGGTPTRATIIGAYTGIPIGRAMGASILETMGDSLIPAIIVLVPAVMLLPGSIFVLLMCVFVLLSWLGGLTAVSSVRVVNYFYSKLLKLVPRMDIICLIEEQRKKFIDSVSEVKSLDKFLVFISTTLVSHLLELYSILYFYSKTLESTLGLGDVMEAFVALETAYVMIAFITPGGSGAVEYGLSVFLPPEVMVKWRIIQILVGVVPGFTIAVSIPRLREYIKVTIEPGPSCRKE